MTDPKIYALAYLSSATTLPKQSDLDEILAQSRRNNEADGITGLLMFHDGNFFQVLEGPKKAVETCYRRIAQDPRHQGHIVMMREDAPVRRFDNWTMAYVPFENMNATEKKGFLDLQAFRDPEIQRKKTGDGTAAILVNSFLKTLRFR